MVMMLQRPSEEALGLPPGQGLAGQGQGQGRVQNVNSFQVKGGAGGGAGTAVTPVQRNIYLDVKKNRYDGTLGKVQLSFSASSSYFNEVKRE